jgi:hypothetical protein
MGGSGTGGAGTGAGGTGGAPTPCSIDAPFTSITSAPGLNTQYLEAGARLTPDELTVVFYSRQTDADGVTDADLYIAERERVDQAFGAARQIELSVDELDEMSPWISPDGLTLFYDTGPPQATGASYDRVLRRATRSSRTQEFSDIRDLGGGFAPYAVGGPSGTLYFAYPAASGGIRQSSLDLWLPNPAHTVVVPPVSQRSAVTLDELTIYFGDGPDSTAGIQVARRASRNEPFGNPAAVSELGGNEVLGPGWISPDNCRLYFDHTVDMADRDIAIAERRPP